MIAPARWAAYCTLRTVNAGQGELGAALVRRREELADARDRALAAELATGTLRWQGQLDFLIAHFARRPVSKLDPEVADILRLAAYQLLHLDRVPAAAAVNDAVDMTRRAGKRSATGLVNGVLRALERHRAALPLPAAPRNPDASRTATLDYLSVGLSHPRWLVTRWLARHGYDATTRWAAFNNSAAPLTIRANRLRTTPAELAERLAAEGVVTRPARYAPDGLVSMEGSPLATHLAGTGLFFVQDEASQLVPLLAGARPGWRVLDACASPGGKTTALAAMMEDRGLLVAVDVRPRRVELLRRTVAASAAACIRIVQADVAVALPVGPWFDLVLIDAPCSGLGTIRRDPEIRWRRTEADLALLAAAQERMLEQAAAAVKPGGRLVYATCSSEPEENEGVVAAFLSSHPEFETADPRAGLPEQVRPLVDEAGHLRTLPFAHGLEAFFAAVLVRRWAGGSLQ
jgi:16S rRNA (cytosine967-C5)-methyltransferase